MNNREAFLAMIGVSEGTSTWSRTKNLGYDVIVGRELFTDFSDHPFAHGRPAKVLNVAGLASTAAGRYQILLRTWRAYQASLGLQDFGPASQDAVALQLIRERGALPLIDSGQFALAVGRCKNIWASFPGAGYGQGENSIDRLRDAYVAAGGQLYVDHVAQAPAPEPGYWGNEIRR